MKKSSFVLLFLSFFVILAVLGCSGGSSNSGSGDPPSSSSSSSSTQTVETPSPTDTTTTPSPTDTTSSPTPTPTDTTSTPTPTVTEPEILSLNSSFGTTGGGAYSGGVEPVRMRNPRSLTINSGNNIVFVDHDNYRWQEVFSTVDDAFFAWGSYGTGNNQFLDPEGIAVDIYENNTIYISEKGGTPSVKVFTVDGGFLGKIGEGVLQRPEKIALDSQGQLHVADSLTNKVYKFTRAGGLGLTVDYGFNQLKDVTVDSQDNIYVADTGNNRICKFDSEGNFILSIGFGTGQGDFISPVAITTSDYVFDGDRHEIFVCDRDNYRVNKFRGDGTYISSYDCSSIGKPIDITGNDETPIYVLFDQVDKVYKFSPFSGTYHY